MKKFSLILTFIILFTFLTIPAYAAEYTDDMATHPFDMDYYTKYKGKDLTLNVYNWGEYISDGSDGTLNINEAFEKLTGIKVVYSTFDTNESLYAKLKTGGSSYDVIIPSDYMISRMIDEGLIQPINFDNVPNFKYIDKAYINPSYDSENKYSIPYTWGTVGLIYNTELIDENEEIDSWSVMWSEAYRDNILMFGNSKDAYAIAFKMLGYPINAESEEQIEKATELLKEQKPLLQAYVMDEIFDKMTGEEAVIAPYYAGDALTMISDNPKLNFVIPKEGSNIFTDAMCIPTNAKNKELAEMYINFMLEPPVGLANIEYIGYSTANTAVFDLLDDEIKNNHVAYPDREVLANCEYFYHLDPKLAALMDEKWTEVLTSDEHYNELLMPMLLVFCVVLSITLNVVRSIRKKKNQ